MFKRVCYSSICDSSICLKISQFKRNMAPKWQCAAVFVATASAEMCHIMDGRCDVDFSLFANVHVNLISRFIVPTVATMLGKGSGRARKSGLPSPFRLLCVPCSFKLKILFCSSYSSKPPIISNCGKNRGCNSWLVPVCYNGHFRSCCGPWG